MTRTALVWSQTMLANRWPHKPAQSAQLIKDSGAVLSYDGDTGFGRIVGIRAMEEGVIRAKKHGIGCVALETLIIWGIGFMPNTTRTVSSQVTMLTWWDTILWLFLLVEETQIRLILFVAVHVLMVNTLCSTCHHYCSGWQSEGGLYERRQCRLTRS